MTLAERIKEIVGDRGFRWSRSYEHQYKQMPSQWRSKLRSMGLIARLDDDEAVRSDVVVEAIGLSDEDDLLRAIADRERLLSEDHEEMPMDYTDDEAAFGSLEVHPALACLPVGMDLTDSIEADGLAQPIVLDAQIRIVDGRSRLAACLATQTPVRWVSLADIAPGMDPSVYVIMSNCGPRRSLTAKEKAVAVARIVRSVRSAQVVSLARASEVNRMYVEYALSIMRSDEADLIAALDSDSTPLYKLYHELRERIRQREQARADKLLDAWMKIYQPHIPMDRWLPARGQSTTDTLSATGLCLWRKAEEDRPSGYGELVVGDVELAEADRPLEVPLEEWPRDALIQEVRHLRALLDSAGIPHHHHKE